LVEMVAVMVALVVGMVVRTHTRNQSLDEDRVFNSPNILIFRPSLTGVGMTVCNLGQCLLNLFG